MSNGVVISNGKTPDNYGRVWPEGYELCPVCSQPDNCGDCTHGRLSDDDVDTLLYGPEDLRDE